MEQNAKVYETESQEDYSFFSGSPYLEIPNNAPSVRIHEYLSTYFISNLAPNHSTNSGSLPMSSYVIGDPDHIRIIEEKCRVFYRYSRAIHDHTHYICLDSHDTNM
jgi:hypothetical protein